MTAFSILVLAFIAFLAAAVLFTLLGEPNAVDEEEAKRVRRRRA